METNFFVEKDSRTGFLEETKEFSFFQTQDILLPMNRQADIIMNNSQNVKPWIFELSLEELSQLLVQNGHKAFRAKQVFQWIYSRFQCNPEKMDNLPGKMRTDLAEIIDFSLPILIRQKTSSDESATKFAFTFNEDEAPVESVLMFNRKRKPTLCVSSQIGCPLKCSFCSTAKMGFTRNLTTAEIVFQVWFMRKELLRRKLQISHNIVYMGMGEPLLNRKALGESMKIFHDEKSFGISYRNMTVSTAGVLDGIEWLSENYPQVNLAVSLNSSIQKTRNEIMPTQCSSPIKKLIDGIKNHYEQTRRLPTIEYVLLKGINMSRAEAVTLVKLLDGLDCRVNLIPFNPPNEKSKLQRPELEDQQFFLSILKEHGIKATLRRSSGKDIGAGCGQLATKVQKQQV